MEVIEQIKKMSELEIQAFVEDFHDHLRKNKMNHLIGDSERVEELEDDINELEEKLSKYTNAISKMEDLVSDMDDCLTSI